MAEEAKKENTDHINLKVLGQDGQVVHFKIKQHTSLKKLISAYCARSKLAQSTVRFRFDGQAISENDTPRGLDMEDGDTIEVFQQQTGGLSSPTHRMLSQSVIIPQNCCLEKGDFSRTNKYSHKIELNFDTAEVSSSSASFRFDSLKNEVLFSRDKLPPFESTSHLQCDFLSSLCWR
ncbi:Rad60/SUMO-like domain [Trinorchestia longiramus]|nr:Rad60/SUMO-like domain [Trinorchestia longiramus]